MLNFIFSELRELRASVNQNFIQEIVVKKFNYFK